MRVLLDTHVFMWWINEDARLSREAVNVLAAGENELLFSAASGWEMAIKLGLGKLTVNDDLGPYISRHLAENAMVALPVSLSHAVGVTRLPAHHRDPFDRLLVAQAMVEGVPLVSADPQVARYPIDVIW